MSNREEFEKLPRIAGILVETGVYYSHINERYTSCYEKGHESYLCGFVNGAWHAWQSRVPEGYVVAPKEPTQAMLDSARDWSTKKYGKAVGNDGASGCYKAMLEAVEK